MTGTPTGTSPRAAPYLTPGGRTPGSGLPTPGALSCGALARRLTGRQKPFPPVVRRRPLSTSLGCASADPPWTPGPLRAAGQEGTQRAGDRHDLGERPQVGSAEAALSHQVRALTPSQPWRQREGGRRSRAVPTLQISSGPSRRNKAPGPALSHTCCAALGQSLSFSMLLCPILTSENSTRASPEGGVTGARGCSSRAGRAQPAKG